MAGYAPRPVREMIELLTGIFEGGTYCTLCNSAADTQGGLSYGTHQASERQGNLVALLKLYTGRAADPLPDPGYAAQVETHLALYDDAGRRYHGTGPQRAAFEKLLKTICNDPAMRQAQDDFFHRFYFVPAMLHASSYGVLTPLGQSICYDIAIQAGAWRLSFYRAALARWIFEKKGPPCTCCSPQDAAGPDEISFLRYVNGARRSEMRGSGSPAYRATVYRPNEFDKLLDSGNLHFARDFVFKGFPVKALP